MNKEQQQIYQEAIQLPQEERTRKQEVVIFQAEWEQQKQQNRHNNVLLHQDGYINTSSGRTYVHRGVGQGKKR